MGRIDKLKRLPEVLSPGVLRRRLVAGVLIAALVVPVAAVGATAKTSDSGVSVVGRLPEPDEASDSHRYVIGVDEKREKLYYLWRRNLEINVSRYDLSKEIPRVDREAQVGTYDEFQLDYASPYIIAVDYKHQLAYFMGLSVQGTPIRVIDLRSLKVLGTWQLGNQIPGFFGEGLTYSHKDERLYIVGNVYGEGHAKVASQITQASPAAAVVAVTPPKKRDGEPTISWARAIPECQYVLSTFAVGALIARSENRPALYFGCVRPDPYPGQSGLVRLWIDPSGESHPDAAAFDLDFFPISGSYTDPPQGVSGSAAFDPKTERFFFQSTSASTPGTWVFDGRLSSWVGFVAAPNSQNRYLGLDPDSGRFYIGSPGFQDRKGYLLVTDGRATPIPQGRVYMGPGIEGFVTTAKDRLFVRTKLRSLGFKAEEQAEGFAVLKDDSPPPQRPRPVDYDMLTSDSPEGPKTITDYSSGVSGFGSRMVMVGGYGGVLTVLGQQVELSQLRAGDRGFTFARVSGVDLRPSGAAATAQAITPDLNTEGDLKDGAGQEWPWRIVSCLNGGGDTVSDKEESNGGTSSVECDLSKARVSSEAAFGSIEASGVSVAHSSFRSYATRDAKLGSVTTARADARGIEIPVPAGTLSIARVSSLTRTSAHGHVGTAKATWDREVSGVELRDADGNVIQRLGSCDSSDPESQCRALERQINELLPQKISVEFPRPRVDATDGGAFAAVQQRDGDFYQQQTVSNQGTVFTGEEGARAVPAMQVTVFNDAQEKSRLLLQLAALQANSIYTITPQGESVPPGKIEPLDRVGAGISAGSSAGGGGGTAGLDLTETTSTTEVSGTPGSAPAVLASSPLPGPLGLIARTPQEAVLVGLVWMTFALSGWTFFRRSRLLDVIRGGN